ncbi:exo-alpha-sialidase [Parabacteroides sp. OttesenSCG-928-G06]|nr:exo-alpha-sialidase [Parabacteroides sp. OttesenSCG-928-G06]
MKRILFSFFFMSLVFSLQAVETVRVKQNRVPVMLERSDNVVYFLQMDVAAGKQLNDILLSFGAETNLEEIAAVRLYYGGTEAVQNERMMRYAPNAYIHRDKPGQTRDANLSYSVLCDEKQKPQRQITLKANRSLTAGINYFWVSVQMKPNTPLTCKWSLKIDEVLIDKQPASLTYADKDPYMFRMGIGVRHAGDDGSAAYRIPGIVTTNKGSLVGVYDVRYNNSADLQEYVDIGVSRSTDKGQTWEPMRIAMAFGEAGGFPKSQNGVGDPAILVDRVTGRLWVIAAWTQGMGNGRAWFNSQQGMDHKTAQLMLAYSDDDGQTWSAPINITEQVKDPSWYFLLQGPGMGITMQDGTLVFAAQYINEDREPSSCIIYSKDRGKTWHLHNAPRLDTTEAQVAEIEPGVLMLNMRDNRGGSRAVYTTKDLGKTWEKHPSSRSLLREPVCMASLIQSNAKENVLGKDVLLFANPNTVKGRNHITIKASLDGGLTFPEEYQVMIDEGDGWGYSCLTMIDRETVGILYEGSTAHMVFQAIPLKDIVK